MANITAELETIKNAVYGSEIRSALYSALKKIDDTIGGSSIVNQDITIKKYDSISFNVELEGLTEDLTYARFAVTQDYAQTGTVLASLGHGIEKEDTGLYSVHITGVGDGSHGLTEGTYIYEFYVVAGTDKYTVLQGNLTVLPSISTGSVNPT